MYLEIGGVTVKVFKDTLSEEEINVGDVMGRASSGALVGSLSTRKRAWRFTTTPLEAVEADKLREWIEGRGQSWRFNLGLLSAAGVQNSVAGTLTANASGGKRDGRLTVGGGSAFLIDPSNKLYKPGGWLATTHGYTIGFWRLNTGNDLGGADGWHHYIIVGNVTFDFDPGSGSGVSGVTVYKDGVALGGGDDNLDGWFQVMSGEVGPWGADNNTPFANGAHDFSDFWIVGFQIPASWVPGIYTFAQSYDVARFPFVKARGDAFNDSSPIDVMCRVRSISQMNAKLPEVGSHKANNRILEVTMEEA